MPSTQFIKDEYYWIALYYDGLNWTIGQYIGNDPDTNDPGFYIVGQKDPLYICCPDMCVPIQSIDSLNETVRRLAKYYHDNTLNYQHEKMGDYVRELEALLPEVTP